MVAATARKRPADGGASGHCPRNAAFMRQSGVRPDPCRINGAFRPTAALNLGAVPGCARPAVAPLVSWWIILAEEAEDRGRRADILVDRKLAGHRRAAVAEPAFIAGPRVDARIERGVRPSCVPRAHALVLFFAPWTVRNQARVKAAFAVLPGQSAAIPKPNPLNPAEPVRPQPWPARSPVGPRVYPTVRPTGRGSGG